MSNVRHLEFRFTWADTDELGLGVRSAVLRGARRLTRQTPAVGEEGGCRHTGLTVASLHSIPKEHCTSVTLCLFASSCIIGINVIRM